jgi:SWIRM-associated region 1
VTSCEGRVHEQNKAQQQVVERR